MKSIGRITTSKNSQCLHMRDEQFTQETTVSVKASGIHMVLGFREETQR